MPIRAPSPYPNRPTVFVIDDDASVRRGLGRLLRAEGYEVETFESARDFLARPAPTGCGCIVLDVRLPGLSGFELQEQLVGSRSSLPVVFISGHGDIPMTVEALRKGALNFLTKPIDKNDLLSAIRECVTRHEGLLSESEQAAETRDLLSSLTPREREVMDLVVAGLLNKQIAHRLAISEATVKVHRGRVMRKLRVRSVADLVRMVRLAG